MLKHINIQNFKFIKMLKKQRQYVNAQKFENKFFLNNMISFKFISINLKIN